MLSVDIGQCHQRGGSRECIAQQVIGDAGHWLSLTLAFAVKRADHVVGEPGGIEVAWHGFPFRWVRVQRRGLATRLLSRVIANAPQSIGSQNSEKIEHTSATIAIHAKMRT